MPKRPAGFSAAVLAAGLLVAACTNEDTGNPGGGGNPNAGGQIAASGGSGSPGGSAGAAALSGAAGTAGGVHMTGGTPASTGGRPPAQGGAPVVGGSATGGKAAGGTSFGGAATTGGSGGAGCVARSYCLDGTGNEVPGCGANCGGINLVACASADLVCVYSAPTLAYDGPVQICVAARAAACTTAADCACIPGNCSYYGGAISVGFAWSCNSSGKCAGTCR
jgi:hypothetical protein